MEFKGLLVGGVVPALAFGLAGLLQKAAARSDPGTGPYLVCVGGGVLLVGLAWSSFSPARSIGLPAGTMAVGIGASWAAGMALVALALTRYGVPLSKLAPLYNMNTLVVVLLALIVFAEAREVAFPRLLLGTLLILAGGVVVARA